MTSLLSSIGSIRNTAAKSGACSRLYEPLPDVNEAWGRLSAHRRATLPSAVIEISGGNVRETIFGNSGDLRVAGGQRARTVALYEQLDSE